MALKKNNLKWKKFFWGEFGCVCVSREKKRISSMRIKKKNRIFVHLFGHWRYIYRNSFFLGGGAGDKKGKEVKNITRCQTKKNLFLRLGGKKRKLRKFIFFFQLASFFPHFCFVYYFFFASFFSSMCMCSLYFSVFLYQHIFFLSFFLSSLLLFSVWLFFIFCIILSFLSLFSSVSLI